MQFVAAKTAFGIEAGELVVAQISDQLVFFVPPGKTLNYAVLRFLSLPDTVILCGREANLLLTVGELRTSFRSKLPSMHNPELLPKKILTEDIARLWAKRLIAAEHPLLQEGRIAACRISRFDDQCCIVTIVYHCKGSYCIEVHLDDEGCLRQIRFLPPSHEDETWGYNGERFRRSD